MVRRGDKKEENRIMTGGEPRHATSALALLQLNFQSWETCNFTDQFPLHNGAGRMSDYEA